MLVATTAREQGVALLDNETPLHFGIGVGAGVLGINAGWAVLAALAGEMAYHASRDGAHRAVFGKLLPAGSLGNHAADVAATLAGVYIGRWLVRAF